MLIGVSNPDPARLFDESFLKRFGTSEWDAATLLELNSRRRKTLSRLLANTGHRIVLSTALTPARDPEASLERLRIFSEVLDELGGLALCLRPRKPWLEDPRTLEQLIRELRAAATAPEIWLEPGREFLPACSPELSSEPAGSLNWVADPLWHPRALWSRARVLKCHGWHEARWIRYYGPEQLEQIRKCCERSKKATVLLWGHSKREEEALRFGELKLGVQGSS
jgi:hypothetical protein